MGLHKHQNIEVKFVEKSDTFSVELFNCFDRKPDCKIGHFGYNFYFRTPYGEHYKEYKNIKTLWKAIKKVAPKHGLTPVSIGIKLGWRYRPLLTA